MNNDSLRDDVAERMSQLVNSDSQSGWPANTIFLRGEIKRPYILSSLFTCKAD